MTGYIIGNLLKHKEVSTFRGLKQSPFSSYKYIAEKFGDKMAKNLVRSVINIEENNEGKVEINELELPQADKPPPWAA